MKTNLKALIVVSLLSGITAIGQTQQNKLETTGAVGVGTLTPSSLLDVEKNYDGTTFVEITNSSTGTAARRGISIGNGNSGYSVYLMSTSENYNQVASWIKAGVLGTDSQLNNGLILRTSAGKIRFQPGSTVDQIVFTEGGYVGIGTTNPDMPLTVNGNIHTKEVKVDLAIPAPDYVFLKEYQLKTLEEVEKYIVENGHLPEVPSASELEQNGLMLAQMNMTLLKKIEELTLYSIEQKKEIERLKLLEERLAKIEKMLLEK